MAVIANRGLPPICKSKNGWKLVKDLLREVLAGRGMLDPIYGKPGMVHVKSAPVGQPTLNYQGTPHAEGRTEMVWAHCNMKTPAAAICAWHDIAGHKWWGHDLAAAVFPSTAWEGGCRFDSAVPVNGQQPHELTMRFKVSLDGIHPPRSKAKADAASVQGTAKDASPKKRPIEAQERRLVRRRCTSTGRNSSTSWPPLNRASKQGSPPPPYTGPNQLEKEHRGREPQREANGHHHEPVPEITVEDYSE
ncbi:MAG: hypothetical protein Q9192_000982 [Flavoplaca navasiana]